LTLQSDLLEEFKLDSLDKVEVVVAIEEEFGLELPNELFDEFPSLDGIAKYLSKLKHEKSKIY
jgi:acyl carrier protein